MNKDERNKKSKKYKHKIKSRFEGPKKLDEDAWHTIGRFLADNYDYKSRVIVIERSDAQETTQRMDEAYDLFSANSEDIKKITITSSSDESVFCLEIINHNKFFKPVIALEVQSKRRDFLSEVGQFIEKLTDSMRIVKVRKGFYILQFICSYFLMSLLSEYADVHNLNFVIKLLFVMLSIGLFFAFVSAVPQLFFGKKSIYFKVDEFTHNDFEVRNRNLMIAEYVYWLATVGAIVMVLYMWIN